LSFAGNETDKITIEHQFYTRTESEGGNAIHEIRFADGTVWDAAYIHCLAGPMLGGRVWPASTGVTGSVCNFCVVRGRLPTRLPKKNV
jgi:hypothetical protein